MNSVKNINTCPICESDSDYHYKLSKEDIINKLSYYWRAQPSIDVVDTDYILYKCKHCNLEFSDPMTPGNDQFYSWIVSMKDYYSPNRWEFQVVMDDILKRGEGKLVDIGCGDGIFLSKFEKENGIDCYGLEKTSEVVKIARSKGLNVFDYNVDDSLYNNLNVKFDYITLFHVLEHVPKPLSFVNSILDILKENGKLYISTPHSPMDFEKNWFDIMNHPPHHMSRFTIKSYQELANKLNCSINFKLSPSPGILKRLYLNIGLLSNSIHFNAIDVLSFICKSPITSLKIFTHTISTKYQNTILVEMSKKIS